MNGILELHNARHHGNSDQVSVPEKFSLSLNSRVSISRPAEGEFFPSSVVGFVGLKAEVFYDDGGEDTHD